VLFVSSNVTIDSYGTEPATGVAVTVNWILDGGTPASRGEAMVRMTGVESPLEPADTGTMLRSWRNPAPPMAAALHAAR
jgi:hypothetical protein